LIRKKILLALAVIICLLSAQVNVIAAQTVSIALGQNGSYLSSGRIMVQLRDAADALGVEPKNIFWDANSRTATFVKDERVVQISVGSTKLKLNGVELPTDKGAEIKNGRIYVPLSVAGIAFDAVAVWDSSTKVATLSLGSGNSDTSQPSGFGDNPVISPVPQTPNASEFEREVFDLVNEERAKQGLNALEWHTDLAAIARRHSQDMAERNFFSHDNPDGLSPFDRMTQNGITYSWAAENIAQGQRTPKEVMQTWMNSPGHKANILNENLTHLGVGFYNYYWTEKFIGI